MAGIKHTWDGQDKNVEKSKEESPFMPIFDNFRNELDEHHDRRERIIKASRDITALSKKMIFSLQRVKELHAPIPSNISQENSVFQEKIHKLFMSIVPDLEGMNFWRYHRQVSPGVQEYMEAVSFQHYLETQRLIAFQDAQSKLPQGIPLSEDDYLLGIFDLTGELMRFAITRMAINGKTPGDRSLGIEAETRGIFEGRNSMVIDLRSLRTNFEALDPKRSMSSKEIDKKIDVMKASVEKVENSVYGMIVRGSERPKGWVPDESKRVPEQVESY